MMKERTEGEKKEKIQKNDQRERETGTKNEKIFVNLTGYELSYVFDKKSDIGRLE